MESGFPLKIFASEIEPRLNSVYPEPFASKMNGREKRALGDLFGISKFGVNLTTLRPGASSALLHNHSRSEEFVYVLRGQLTLLTDTEEILLHPGDCAGFIPAGPPHMLVNQGNEEAQYLEIGDREAGDAVTYPIDDLEARKSEEGKWVFFHKDGTPY